MTHDQLNEIIKLKERAAMLNTNQKILRSSIRDEVKLDALKSSGLWPHLVKSADALMEAEIKTANDRIEFLMEQ
jgi:hypothetical protein